MCLPSPGLINKWAGFDLPQEMFMVDTLLARKPWQQNEAEFGDKTGVILHIFFIQSFFFPEYCIKPKTLARKTMRFCFPQTEQKPRLG